MWRIYNKWDDKKYHSINESVGVEYLKKYLYKTGYNTEEGKIECLRCVHINPIFYVDMDGVLVDWYRKMIIDHGQEYDIDYILSRDTKKIEEIFPCMTRKSMDDIMNDYNWWKNIPKTPECDELLDVVNTYTQSKNTNIILLSKPKNIESIIGKIIWIKNNLKFAHSYVFTKRKYNYADNNSILIDDYSKNTTQFSNHGGNVILYPCVVNENRRYFNNRIEFLRKKLFEIFKQREKFLNDDERKDPRCY